MALEVWGLTFSSCFISFPHLRKSLMRGSLCIVWLFVVGCHWPVLWKPQWYRGSGAPRSERRIEVLLGESLERHECGPSNPEVYVNCIKWGSCGVYLFAWPEWVTKINFPQEGGGNPSFSFSPPPDLYHWPLQMSVTPTVLGCPRIKSFPPWAADPVLVKSYRQPREYKPLSRSTREHDRS